MTCLTTVPHKEELNCIVVDTARVTPSRMNAVIGMKGNYIIIASILSELIHSSSLCAWELAEPICEGILLATLTP